MFYNQEQSWSPPETGAPTTLVCMGYIHWFASAGWMYWKAVDSRYQHSIITFEEAWIIYIYIYMQNILNHLKSCSRRQVPDDEEEQQGQAREVIGAQNFQHNTDTCARVVDRCQAVDMPKRAWTPGLN